ncbi:MAG: hypothetical protein V4726_21345 [Verrucomicrobiota bacterium]
MKFSLFARCATGLLFVAASSFVVFGAPPAWWQEPARPFTDPAKTAQDRALLAQGQLRQALKRVVQELDAKYAAVGGAGVQLHDAVANVPNAQTTNPPAALFADSRKFNVVKVGQLKFISKLVYDRLDGLGISYGSLKQNPATLYPWAAGAAPGSDTSGAAIGQLKYLFSFDTRPDADHDGILDPLSAAARARDRDGDGMTDQWESAYGLNFRAAAASNLDTDGDGAPDRLDTDPVHAGGALTIEIFTPSGHVL